VVEGVVYELEDRFGGGLAFAFLSGDEFFAVFFLLDCWIMGEGSAGLLGSEGDWTRGVGLNSGQLKGKGLTVSCD